MPGLEDQMKVQRYKELEEWQKNEIADVRAIGDQLQILFSRLESIPEVDKRWLAISRTAMQQGIMYVNRAIIKPDFF